MSRIAAVTCTVLACRALMAGGETPAEADLALVRHARTALSDVRAFERLNTEIVRRCGEPVTGAWADWRDEFHADLERAHGLQKALQQRAPDPVAEARADDRLKPFTEVDGAALYSRCVRWSSLLIQHESPVRAGIAEPLAFLRNNEQRLWTIAGNDGEWQEWRAAGAVP